MRSRHLPVLGRRHVLQWIGTTAGTLALPGGWLACSRGSSPSAPPAPPYFSPEDAAIVNALADAIIPPDDAPGGSELGAVGYLSTLLTAFDHDPPLIFAGGPYSGRVPQPAANGGPSTTYPSNEFTTFLPLDRVQIAAWKLRIFGSAGVPGGGPNDAITGPIVGLRDAVASAIAQGRAAMPANVTAAELTQADKATMLGAIDSATQSTMIDLVTQAAYSAPEYGGNPDMAGWKMVYFEGDALPLGYSWFDPATGSYTEDPNHPISTANPTADPYPMDSETETLFATVIGVLGGQVFS